ncbi:MAG TPA: hypothetical protein GX405_02520 [Rhizobiales bacterium]|nr:hypothetical protein [Hyphomicrobiales bacterium]
MLRLLTATFKIAVVSLITGAALSAVDITAADVFAKVGLTEERVIELLESGVRWAVPNLVLGSMIIVPIWILVYLLRPPRG